MDANDYYGQAVDGIGDIDGNGAGDIIVGAYGDDDGAASAGASYIHLLDTDGTILSTQKFSTTTVTEINTDNNASDYYGYGLA